MVNYIYSETVGALEGRKPALTLVDMYPSNGNNYRDEKSNIELISAIFKRKHTFISVKKPKN